MFDNLKTLMLFLRFLQHNHTHTHTKPKKKTAVDIYIRSETNVILVPAIIGPHALICFEET